MAKFTFGKEVDIHWNGYEIVGPALTEFTIPDQLYEEFESDFRAIEPSLTWIDTNEFATLSASVSVSTLSATAPIALTSTSTGKTISFSSGTALNGYLLSANGSGGSIWTPASTSGLTSVVGVSPISSTVNGGTVSVSLNANYQTAGTYVSSVSGSSPLSTSGTTAVTVTIDQSLLTAGAATTAEGVRTPVKNTTGSTITKGSVVYVNGSDGTNATIALSTASAELGSSKTLGIVSSTLTNNAFGYVTENGQLSGIDTSAATAGSSVWLGNTPGSIVFNNPPAEPSNSVYLGVVTKANPSTGEILVKVQNGYEIDELHDVSADAPSDLDILQYKNSSGMWTKASIDNAGIAASVHTHNYQTSGTYVNAVIGTSPASVSTASGTATVSISSGTATNGQVLTANGSGGVSFATLVSSSFSGPVSSIDNTIARYNGTGGQTVQGSSVVIDDSNDVFFPATIAHSPVSVSLSSNTYTLNLSSGNYFTGITAGSRIHPTFVTSTSIDFGAATSGTLPIPSGLQVGDYLIGVIGSDGGSAVLWNSSLAESWTKVSSVVGGTGFAYGYLFIAKITTAGQTAISGGPFSGLLTASTGAVYVLRGVSTYQDLVTNTGTTGMPAVADLKGVVPNSIVIAVGFLDDDNITATAPTGYTNIVSQSSSVAGFTTMIAMQATTATGNQDFLSTSFGGSGTDDWSSMHLSVFGSRSDRYVTLSSPPDQAISGFSNAKAHTIVINCASTTSGLINWDSKIIWASNGAPSLNTQSLVVLTSYDGLTYYGNYSNFY